METNKVWTFTPKNAEQSPLVILNKYVALLERDTDGKISGEIIDYSNEKGEIIYTFSLIVPNLNNYRIKLMTIVQPRIDKYYPAHITLFGQAEDQIIKKNKIPKDKFEQELLRLIKHEYTNSIIGSIFSFLQNREKFYPSSDFMTKICYDLFINDLNKNAIELLKKKYFGLMNEIDKKKAEEITSFSKEALLTDLKLLNQNQLNYAALLLLGENEKINEFLPQARIVIEYRSHDNQIHFESQHEIQTALILAVEEAVEIINQRNTQYSFIYNLTRHSILLYNENVLREAILNALMHRDYSISSTITIKQYPNRIEFINPGGFPQGVNIENILTVNSTPRSHLLADVLRKIGSVEKSGQGVDRMYYATLIEGKKIPDYSLSDNGQVVLRIYGEIEDKAFYLFIKQVQDALEKKDELSVLNILTLYQIKKGKMLTEISQEEIRKLYNKKLIKRIGATSSNKFRLNDDYLNFKDVSEKDVEIGGIAISDLRSIANCFENKTTVKMGDFVEQLPNSVKRHQVKYIIDKLSEQNIILQEGKGRGTKYKLNRTGYKENDDNYLIISEKLSSP